MSKRHLKFEDAIIILKQLDNAIQTRNGINIDPSFPEDAWQSIKAKMVRNDKSIKNAIIK